jgi:hypothetical protein
MLNFTSGDADATLHRTPIWTQAVRTSLASDNRRSVAVAFGSFDNFGRGLSSLRGCGLRFGGCNFQQAGGFTPAQKTALCNIGGLTIVDAEN